MANEASEREREREKEREKERERERERNEVRAENGEKRPTYHALQLPNVISINKNCNKNKTY